MMHIPNLMIFFDIAKKEGHFNGNIASTVVFNAIHILRWEIFIVHVIKMYYNVCLTFFRKERLHNDIEDISIIMLETRMII